MIGISVTAPDGTIGVLTLLPIVPNRLSSARFLRRENLFEHFMRPAAVRPRAGEVEERTSADLTGHSDLAAVQFNDGSCNGKAHAGALNSHPLIPPAIEFLENHVLLDVVNPRPMIRNTGNYLTIA